MQLLKYQIKKVPEFVSPRLLEGSVLGGGGGCVFLLPYLNVGGVQEFAFKSARDPKYGKSRAFQLPIILFGIN